MTSRFFVIACLAVLALNVISPALAFEAAGIWLVQDRSAKVRIVTCGEAVCGAVIWLSQPIDQETGRPLTDKLNSDPNLRARPVLGLPVLLYMQRMGEDAKWIGRVYNPDDGNTYRGTIELLDATRLKVEGCVGIYCQAEIWTRSN